jgi:hypothetical protein
MYYYANQKTIALNYCVNKSKPALHCNGKCFINKQLKKYDSQSSTASLLNQIKQVKDILWYCSKLDFINFKGSKPIFIQPTYFYRVVGLQNIAKLVFHPPPEI